MLKDVEKRLADVLAQASKAKSAKVRRGKKAEVAGWGSAGEFVGWWKGQWEREK